MLRHSPLPPLVLGAALALGLALTGTRTEPMPEAPAVPNTAAAPPGGEGRSRAIEPRHAGPHAL